MNNIQLMRAKAKMTQGELAALLKVDRSTVAKWESYKALPRAEMLRELARILHCRIDDLL